MNNSSTYINQSRRDYSLYVLQMRAIPALTDGLKAAARRVLWVARSGEKHKSATLAGKTMPLHPHAAPEGTINTLAAPYGNNVPLLKGYGAFGTLLKPTAYGASRYTSVKISKFAEDVLFCDHELIPMVENYDGTLQEPKHFLPLIPLAILNPTQGIAVGFATNILPRDLNEIIDIQLEVLKGRKRLPENLDPYFAPIDGAAVEYEVTSNDSIAYYFYGKYKTINSNTIQVTQLPYGLAHEKFIDHLDSLIEQNVIIDYEDRSKDVYDIEIKFKRGVLTNLSQTEVCDKLKLISREVENLTVIGLDGESVVTLNPVDLIREFTEWRLGWYLERYKRLKKELEIDIQKYRDILLAIKKNVGSTARTINSRTDLIKHLKEIGIVHTDYIAAFPVYRFTKHEKDKVEKKLNDALELLKTYNLLLKNEGERRKVYASELRAISKRFTNGEYAT